MPNRLTGIAEVLQGIADALGLGDKPWGAGAVALVIGAAFSPILIRNQRTSRARRILIRAGASSNPTEKALLEAEALGEVKGNPLGLVVVADLALQRGRQELARTALAQLQTTGKRTADAIRIRRLLEGDAPSTVDEAIVRVERLLRMGLGAEARRRWQEARKKWPKDEELRELEKNLPQDEAPPQDRGIGSGR